MNPALFRPDKDRIKELGPDRSCAEWLLRCGATIRWKGADSWQNDYNTLPQGGVASMGKFRIEEVEAVEAGIMDVGFDHFGSRLCLLVALMDSIYSYMYTYSLLTYNTILSRNHCQQ